MDWFSWMSDPSAWAALGTLTALEIVLGIDNIVFISILTSRLPEHQRRRARTIGLAMALVGRLALLGCISWIMGLTATLFSVLGNDISGRDLIMLLGGLFLLAKATWEIHDKLEGELPKDAKRQGATMGSVIFQIFLLDAVFSLDSVVTAVGMARQLAVMMIAVIIAVGVMILTAGAVSRFIHKRPTVKMLALSFLLLIGVTLVADGLDFHIPKGYIYFAMAFSVFVEILNLKLRSRARARPVELHEPVLQEPAS